MDGASPLPPGGLRWLRAMSSFNFDMIWIQNLHSTNSGIESPMMGVPVQSGVTLSRQSYLSPFFYSIKWLIKMKIYWRTWTYISVIGTAIISLGLTTKKSCRQSMHGFNVAHPCRRSYSCRVWTRKSLQKGNWESWSPRWGCVCMPVMLYTWERRWSVGSWVSLMVFLLIWSCKNNKITWLPHDLFTIEEIFLIWHFLEEQNWVRVIVASLESLLHFAIRADMTPFTRICRFEIVLVFKHLCCVIHAGPV